MTRTPRAAFSLAALVLAASWAPARHLLDEGERAPSFELSDREGAALSSAALSGKTAALLFVRPGQSRSISALREAEALRRKLTSPPWECLAIVSGEFSEEAVGELISSAEFGGRVLLDPSMKVYGEYGVIVTPSTVVVGREGGVSFSKAGYDYEFDSALGAHVRFALGLIDAAERDRRVEEGRSAVAASHSRAARLCGLARRLRERGKIDEAEELARKALAEDPSAPAPYEELAEILLARGKPVEAMELLGKAPGDALASGPFRLIRGRAFLAQGMQAEAETELRKAVEIDPRPARAHYELGKLYEAQGRKDEAIRELKLAVEDLLRRG